MSRLLEDLDAKFREKVKAALAYMKADPELKALGVKGLYIVETKRNLTTQMAYFCRGRMAKPEDVRAMYKAAGLWKLTDKETQTPNTWTLQSKHMAGLAVDLAPSLDGASAWWAPTDWPGWARMGLIGESFGLAWGGNWPDDQKDRPHFEERK